MNIEPGPSTCGKLSALFAALITDNGGQVLNARYLGKDEQGAESKLCLRVN